MSKLSDMDFASIYTILSTTVKQIANSKYGRQMVLKGGTALITKMLEYHRADLLRKTTDIDLHIADTGLWDAFCNDVEHILNANNSGLHYTLLTRKATAGTDFTCDSLRFNVLADNGVSAEFKIDMNCKPWSSITITPLMSLSSINAYDNLTMLADKIYAVSTKAVYRRIKDIYDICVLTQFERYKSADIIDAVQRKRPELYTGLDIIPLMQADYTQLAHAYNKFDGIQNKPVFEVVYRTCIEFLHPIYRCEGNLQWNLQMWQMLGM